jgi:predicted esterase
MRKTNSNMLGTTRFQVPGKLISDVVMREPKVAASGDPVKPSRVFLLLHGFSQDGQHIFKRLESAISAWEQSSGKQALILAPSGTYPQPERTDNGWRVGYSWYFYNLDTDEYYIDMENAVLLLNGIVAQALAQIRDQIGAQTQINSPPVTVIGFSQGGYLAPFFAKSCPQVDHVIGIGCEFLKDEIADPIRFRLDGIHGVEDAVVDGVNSQKSHAALLERGVKGTFQLLPGEGHKISLAITERVKQLLLST